MKTRSQAELKSKSKFKRQHDNIDGNRRKSQRLAALNRTEETTKIVDLNDDCLMAVFEVLDDLQSLFNVSIANEWLRPAARAVYRRKCGARKVKISGCNNHRSNGRAELFVPRRANRINVTGLKPALLYLRCFGP